MLVVYECCEIGGLDFELQFDEQGDRISSHGGLHSLLSDRSIRNNVDRLFRSMCRETMTVNTGRRL